MSLGEKSSGLCLWDVGNWVENARKTLEKIVAKQFIPLRRGSKHGYKRRQRRCQIGRQFCAVFCANRPPVLCVALHIYTRDVQRKKALPRWPLEKSPQPLSGYITLHIGHITGREGVALQGPRQGVALAPEKNDVTRFHIVLSGAHFSSGAKVLCDKGRHCVQPSFRQPNPWPRAFAIQCCKSVTPPAKETAESVTQIGVLLNHAPGDTVLCDTGLISNNTNNLSNILNPRLSFLIRAGCPYHANREIVHLPLAQYPRIVRLPARVISLRGRCGQDVCGRHFFRGKMP